MNDEYNSGTAYRAMLKLFREARKEMAEEKFIQKRPSCLRCYDRREVWVWKDTTETQKIKVDCPMCSPQRPPQELRDLGVI